MAPIASATGNVLKDMVNNKKSSRERRTGLTHIIFIYLFGCIIIKGTL